MADQRENALQYAHSNRENFLSTFKEILTVPSVSTEKTHIPDIQRAAEWLGARIQGKALREPINVILVDAVAGSADEARARLLQARRSCGKRGEPTTNQRAQLGLVGHGPKPLGLPRSSTRYDAVRELETAE